MAAATPLLAYAQTACPTLSLGSSGPAVTALQQFFVSAYSNFPQSDVTGHFGPITQNAVAEWQSSHGIVTSGTPATTGYGVVGPKTAAAMHLCSPTTSPSPTSTASATLTRTLALGASGTDVLLLQQLLIAGGFLPQGDATGYFGLLTQAAVQSFQAHSGIVSSGSPQTTGYGAVGPHTRAAIAQLLAAPVSSATSTVSTQTGGSTSTPSPVPAPAPSACAFNNQSVASGSSVTAYQAASVPAGQACASETRTCTNGALGGSYQYASCASEVGVGGQCTPDPSSPQTQTLSCPSGQVGMITQTRTSLCASGATSPAWSGWTTTSNTCTTPLPVSPASPPYYGFDYWPPGYDDWLWNYSAAAQSRVIKDIGLMKAMGVNIVRISVFGYDEGLPPWKYNQPAGVQNFDTQAWDTTAANLTQIIKQFGAAGIKVIVTFAPNSYYWYGPQPNADGTWPAYDPQCQTTDIKEWWQCRYAPDRWDDFVWDYWNWENGIEWWVEHDPQASANVLYYDVVNEIQFTDGNGIVSNAQFNELADVVIQNSSNVPIGKMGFSLNPSPIDTNTDIASLKAAFDRAGKQPAYIEVHCYPGYSCVGVGDNLTVAQWFDEAYAKVKAAFPTTQFVIGEWGAMYDGGPGVQQASLDKQLVDWANSTGNVAALVHWNMYDNNPNYGDTTHLLGFAPAPGVATGVRDNYMILGNMMGSLVDGDFENGVGSWFFGGTGAQTSAVQGGAVTGSSFGRLTITAPGRNWFCSPNFVLQHGSHVATGGFIRTTVASVDMGTRYFDSSWGLLGQDDITITQSAPGQWQQIQEQALSKQATDWGAAYGAQVCFAVTAPSGTSTSSPITLDLDSITIHDY